ncbi:MAG: sodium:solute symporter family protein [Candidatus Neomarinimicrobiota bacterium]|nr:sodium:solute symporter family protein [Candidatus Neomarinimicrobiota bacterium]
MGIYLTTRASQNLDTYFLAGRSVPWYILGVSNSSSMFDITGTMWLVLMFLVYGVKGAWIPWIWPTFNQIFLMVYLSIWIRRSNVLTGSEWITTRFGNGKGSELSRISVLVFAMVSVIGFLAYAFQGIGKFASVFFPFDISPELYAIIFMGITTIYVVLGGMYSVVFTDLIQFTLLTIVSFVIGFIAFTRVTPEALHAVIPNGWLDLAFTWELDLDWNDLIPAANNQIMADGWNLFTIFFMMMIFKGILISLAGPTPGYDMQRILAAKTPREAGLMSAIVSVCQIPRWFMIVGITTLALVYFSNDLIAMGDNVDFELVLPWVISEFLPVGLVGFVLAGMLAAFMSTFDSTVNAGAAYLVNDVYKRYFNPNAPTDVYIKASYIASFLIVAVGIAFGFMSESVNSVTQWIVSGLFGGYTAPNILKWHWWRFNGFGYFYGMIAGVLAALIMPMALPELSPLNAFPFILILSGIAGISGSLMTAPDDDKTLEEFYKNVRPWGFWKPILNKIQSSDPNVRKNDKFYRDMFNIFIGMVWQINMVLVPIYLLVYEYTAFTVSLILVIGTTLILKKNWYDKLDPVF